MFIRLCWKGRFGKLPARWYGDTITDQRLLDQFKQEAGVDRLRGLDDADYDRVLAAAGAWGYGIETVGGPE